VTVLLFRVDPRFVHATLMNAWVPHTGAKKVIIADDRATNDPRLRKILEMSTMDLVRLQFVGEEDLGKALEEEPPDQRAIVLFASPAAVQRSVDAGAVIPALNIGHLPEAPDRKPVLPAVHLGPKDLAIISALREKGIDVYLQPLPRDLRSSPFAVPQVPTVVPRSDSVSGLPRRRDATPAPRSEPAPKPAAPVRLQEQLRILNERGLHLRAAHALAHLAGTLDEEVQVGLHGEFVNAKSLLGLTTLGAGCGTLVEVIVSGRDPKSAMDEIRALFGRGFDEGVAWTEGMKEGDS
jgi:D-glucosaminate PTS system EIIB component